MREEAKLVITADMEKVLRRQKHDFVNHIQVIHAYLHVGKPEKALAYLDGLVAEINAGTFCVDYLALCEDKTEESHD